jgi:hypothetical protein
MGRKKIVVEATVEPEVQVEADTFPNNGVEVVMHLDRDPNDPRNKPAKKALPSLDD